MALIGSFVIKNIYFVAFGILIVVALRSIVSELILARYMQVNIFWEVIQEILLVAFFIAGSMLFPATVMFLLYLAVYVAYLLLNKNRVKHLLKVKNTFKS